VQKDGAARGAEISLSARVAATVKDDGAPTDSMMKNALSQQRPISAKHVHRYELNTPSFSDYTNKYRFFRIPPGEQINYA
jgi:hypothetical protein